MNQDWFVYILLCADDSYYTGITTNLHSRVYAHNSGTGAKYTRSRGPVTLIWCAQYTSKSEALRKEYAIKRLSRKRKEELVHGIEGRIKT